LVGVVDRLIQALGMSSSDMMNMDCAIDEIIERVQHLTQSQQATDSQASSLVHELRHKLKKLKQKLNDKVSYFCTLVYLLIGLYVGWLFSSVMVRASDL